MAHQYTATTLIVAEAEDVAAPQPCASKASILFGVSVFGGLMGSMLMTIAHGCAATVGLSALLSGGGALGGIAIAGLIMIIIAIMLLIAVIASQVKTCIQDQRSSAELQCT